MIAAHDLSPAELAALLHFHADAGVDWLLEEEPVHARIRMEMQKGGEFGRGEVVSGDHGRKLPHVPRAGNPQITLSSA
ncbi:hypothetical protein QD336_16455, partial [Rhizobium sp. BR 250]